jgi:hypothetical protein
VGRVSKVSAVAISAERGAGVSGGRAAIDTVRSAERVRRRSAPRDSKKRWQGRPSVEMGPSFQNKEGSTRLGTKVGREVCCIFRHPSDCGCLYGTAIKRRNPHNPRCWPFEPAAKARAGYMVIAVRRTVKVKFVMEVVGLCGVVRGCGVVVVLVFRLVSR